MVNTPQGANIDWSTHDYDIANSALEYWDFPTLTFIQVRNVADDIYRFERDRYMFSDDGSGCRYWV
ncbi:hypothetical protein PHISCL_10883, partial [Aspergillus sclerotialis]